MGGRNEEEEGGRSEDERKKKRRNGLISWQSGCRSRRNQKNDLEPGIVVLERFDLLLVRSFCFGKVAAARQRSEGPFLHVLDRRVLFSDELMRERGSRKHQVKAHSKIGRVQEEASIDGPSSP
jgi:hypothetical protein